MPDSDSGHPRAVIVGGGVAGLEALLALHALAGARTELVLVSPDPDFLYKPLLVEEPFGLEPAERHELAPLAAELDASFILQRVTRIDPERHHVELADGSTIDYAYLVVCTGGRFHPALDSATTFPSREPFRIDQLLGRFDGAPRTIAFVVPAGVAWALPLYEIAMMTARRIRELGLHDTQLKLITPEEAPLAIFGSAASDAVGDLLAARGIEVESSAHVVAEEDEGLSVDPGNRPIEAQLVIALPEMSGPEIDGLPSDRRGFIPIDEHARVVGVEDVYAAGDATNFPIKQGGLATQQADAAAQHIASRLGAEISPEPFHPVLRGQLLTGEESLHLSSDVTEEGGEGMVSPDQLWWPAHKISARYLAPLLEHGEEGFAEPEPPRRTLDVEVSLPKEWHREPMALDPHHASHISS